VGSTPDVPATGSPDYVNLDSTDVLCQPGERQCSGPAELATCNEQGDRWDAAECPSGEGCAARQCIPKVCPALSSKGSCLDAASYERCNESGTAWEIAQCGAGSKCYLGACISQLCTPGQKICKNFTQIQACNGDGDAWVDGETCPSGGICEKGICQSPCEVSIKDGSYMGCEYWALDLDNIDESEYQAVGLVVSVPVDKAGTKVTVTNNQKGSLLTAAELGVADTSVSPGETKVFQLPLGFDIDGTTKTNRSFRVQTTSPVVMHQFNPLNGEGVYTNDASLLLPSKVTGKTYLVMSWPQRTTGHTLRGFATVVATEAQPTEVQITPSCPVAAGNGVPALKAGTLYKFMLSQGEVLNLETDGDEGQDLTGTFIEASQRVSVFAGHECANVPLGTDACDHLEEQLFPVETWSHQYIADGFEQRSESQNDIWRVMAGDNDVTVTTTPPVAGYDKFKLQKGGWLQFAAMGSFMLSADGPILVGHYMTGANYPGAVEVEACAAEMLSGLPEPIGDPSLTLAAPVNRYLKQYAVLTPSGYMNDYLNVIAPEGATVNLDGVAISVPAVSIPGTGYALRTVSVKPGIHGVQSDKAFGLTAYGYDCNVSYAYTGGLKLQGLED
jgi:hypothetical protein